MHSKLKFVLLTGLLVATVPVSSVLRAETIEGALAKAYQSNPELNARRASLRAVDETVTRASAAGRPRVTSTADAGIADQWYKPMKRPAFDPSDQSTPRGAALSVSQTLFSSGKIEAAVKAAESGVLAERANLASSIGESMNRSRPVKAMLRSA